MGGSRHNRNRRLAERVAVASVGMLLAVAVVGSGSSTAGGVTVSAASTGAAAAGSRYSVSAALALRAPGHAAPGGERVVVGATPGASDDQGLPLTSADGNGPDGFGISVALSGNGRTALVGASFASGVDPIQDVSQGAAYVLEFSGAPGNESKRWPRPMGPGGITSVGP
jgi:hypothetical protein